MSTTFTAFDAAEYLDSEEAIAAYLNEAIAEGDNDLLMSALSDIARARGMTKVAEDSGLGRESLYKALRPGSKPGFVTVSKIVGALGVRFEVAPAVRPARATKAGKAVGKLAARKAAAPRKRASA